MTRMDKGRRSLRMGKRWQAGRMRKILGVFLLLVLWILPASIRADDIDIYTNNGGGVQPNVLIIFDNSGSMNEQIQVSFYDPGITYPNHLGVDPNAVYYRSWSELWTLFQDSAGDIPCDQARSALLNQGFYNGWIRWDGTCGGWYYRYLRTGNYRNYLVEVGGSETRAKLDVAKEVIQEFVMSTDGIRIGAMVFNNHQGGRIQHEVQEMTDPNRQTLHDSIGAITANTWTPLAETLYEAGLYFQGENSYFNEDVDYNSPITHWCQKSYVIIITDGESTQDRDPILTTLPNNGDVDGDGNDPGSYASEGSDYLDDVAKYLYDRDLSPLEGKQNLVTYTIGFAIDTELLSDTAANGHGAYYTCNSARELSEVFQRVVQEILETSTSFTAPVVPISQMEKTTSESKIYVALFKPSEDAFWKGNIKKFSLATEAVGGIAIGDILDFNDNRATDNEGNILDSAVSFWGGTEPDGGETEAGGVGQVLLNRDFAIDPRCIYTYVGSSTDLTDSTNAISMDNPVITPERLDVGDTSLRNKIINYIHGYDVLDEDGDLNTSEKRRWLLGAFLHSRPAVVHYDASTSVIFAGANDGMLHAFLDSDGSELWAFIPPDLLRKLKGLLGSALEYFVDGAPKAVVIDQDMDGNVEPLDGDQVILVFGERRGGNRYYALDVTDPTAPVFLWEIHPEPLGDFMEMGQSWSNPVIGKVRIGTQDRMVVFLGGGYDTNQDDDPVVGSDSWGRAIYVIDLFDGSLIWKYTFADNAQMAYCIPSDVAAIDIDEDPEGYIDRLYVGDTGGQIWRFDIDDPSPSNWTGRQVFDDSGSGRKIFYPPDVVFEHDGEMLFWGTGDRAHPKNQSILNRIYALKDGSTLTTLTEADLYNATANLVQDGTEAEQETARMALESLAGWYVELDENLGEKVLAPGIVYLGVLYVTTFTPTAGVEADPCYVGEGTARLYALAYKTAAAVLNFDTGSPELRRSDRSRSIGSAIPSGLIVAFLHGKAVSFIGVGGGVFSSELSNSTAITPIFWRFILPTIGG